jgi:DNA-binding transcriptional regulator YhcF (GntR family)
MRSHIQPVALEDLGILLDRGAEVPLGVQLVWALRARVHDGRLAPGERLPALRDLAEGVGVNSNTVRTVYQRLEHEGLLTSLQGSGTFVTAGPREHSAAGAIAQAAAHEAHETGVDPREVAAALYVAQQKPSKDDNAAKRDRRQLVDDAQSSRSQGGSLAAERGGQAEHRRRLRTRITALEQALAELEVRHPRLASAVRARARSSGDGPRLLDTTELEQVQTELLRRIAAIQMAIDGGPEGEQSDPPRPTKSKAAPSAAKPKVRAKPKARPRATSRPAASGT